MSENHVSPRVRGGAALLLAGIVALSGIGLPSAAFAETSSGVSDAPQADAQPAAQAPAIVEQPDDLVVELGGSAELTVEAEHAAGFRWQKATEVFAERPELPEAWADVDPEQAPSALTSTLKIDEALAEHAGDYRVIVVGDGGETVSEAVRLDVDAPAAEGPATQPDDAETQAGGDGEAPAPEGDDRAVAETEEPGAEGTEPETEEIPGAEADGPSDADSSAPVQPRASELRLPGVNPFVAQPFARSAEAARPLPAEPVFWDIGRGAVDLGSVTFSSFGVVGTQGQLTEARLTDLVDPGTGDGRRLQAWAATSQQTADTEPVRVDVVHGEAAVPWSYSSTEAEQSNRLTVSVGYAPEAGLPETVVYESVYTYRTVPMTPNPVLHAPQNVTVRVGEPAEFVFTASGHPVPFVAAGQQFWNLTSADGTLLDPYALSAGWENVFPDAQQPRNGEYHYRIAAVTPEMDGMTISAIYRNLGIFGNGFGTSPGAKLTVTGYEQPSDWRKPSITSSPEDVLVVPVPGTEGTDVYLTSEGDLGNPSGVLRWQWNRGDGVWKDIESGDASGAWASRGKTLRLIVSDRHSGYSYRAVYSNRLGEAVSDPARVLVQGELGEGSYWGESDPLVVYSVPTVVSLDDEFISVGGRRWLDPSQKKTGSVVSVRISDVTSDPAVRNPATGEPVEAEVIAAVKASSTGRWLTEIPRPDSLEVGKTYTVTIRSGELQSGDKVREETARFTVAPAYELATITQDLPEEFVIGDGPAELRIGATAPTAITYRWEIRRGGEASWDSRTIVASGFDIDGDTLSAASVAEVLNSAQNQGLHGAELRVVLTTPKGSITSKTSTIRLASASQASLSYDASKTYHYGESVQVSGSGFLPNSRQQVFVGAALIGARSNANGDFTVNVPIEAAGIRSSNSWILEPGSYQVTAHTLRDPSGPLAVGAETIEIAPAPGVAAPVVQQGLDEVTEVPEGQPYTFAPVIDGDGIKYSGSAPGGGDFRNGTFSINGDLQTWDGQVVKFVAWNTGGAVRLETEIDVIPADGSPSYPHVTGASTAEGDQALVWVERDAEVGSGKSVRISGKHWTDASGAAGSLIAVKLNFEHLNGQTGQYERTGDKIVLHPKNGTEDVTIWKLITAGVDGSFADTIDLPENLRAGQRLTATVTSGVFKDGDVSRSIVTPPLTVGGIAWDEDDAFAGVCEPSTERPTWSVQEQAELGGTLRISGQGWCHPTNGGSTIAIKIDDGAYSHLTDALNSNRTIWDIAYADDETGDWEIDVTLPDGTTSLPGGSAPALPEGEHSIRLLTGTLKEGDAIRTVGTPTGQNTSFVVGEYRPNALPNPIDIDGGALTDANRNGVAVQQRTTPAPGRWTVTVPSGSEGDWVYIDAYAGSSARGPFPKWYQLDQNSQVELSLAGVTLQAGELSVTVQNGNQGRAGELLGWAPVKIEAPKTDTPAVKPGPVAPRPTPSAAAPSSNTTAAPRTAGGGTRTSAAQSSAPASIPEQPVKRGSQLNRKNAGKVTGTIEGGIVTLTVEDGEPNQWIYAYIYTGVQVRPIGWVQLDEAKQMKVDISELPDGNHKIALVGQDGRLIGWAAAKKGDITTAQLRKEQAGEARQQGDEVAAATPVLAVVSGIPSWAANALLGGGSLLLLAAAVAAALVIRNRREQS